MRSVSVLKQTAVLTIIHNSCGACIIRCLVSQALVFPAPWVVACPYLLYCIAYRRRRGRVQVSYQFRGTSPQPFAFDCCHWVSHTCSYQVVLLLNANHFRRWPGMLRVSPGLVWGIISRASKRLNALADGVLKFIENSAFETYVSYTWLLRRVSMQCNSSCLTWVLFHGWVSFVILESVSAFTSSVAYVSNKYSRTSQHMVRAPSFWSLRDELQRRTVLQFSSPAASFFMRK